MTSHRLVSAPPFGAAVGERRFAARSPSRVQGSFVSSGEEDNDRDSLFIRNKALTGSPFGHVRVPESVEEDVWSQVARTRLSSCSNTSWQRGHSVRLGGQEHEDEEDREPRRISGTQEARGSTGLVRETEFRGPRAPPRSRRVTVGYAPDKTSDEEESPSGAAERALLHRVRGRRSYAHPDDTGFSRNFSLLFARSAIAARTSGTPLSPEGPRQPRLIDPALHTLQQGHARVVAESVVEPRRKWHASLRAFQSSLRMLPSDAEEEEVGYESEEEDSEGDGTAGPSEADYREEYNNANGQWRDHAERGAERECDKNVPFTPGRRLLRNGEQSSDEDVPPEAACRDTGRRIGFSRGPAGDYWRSWGRKNGRKMLLNADAEEWDEQAEEIDGREEPRSRCSFPPNSSRGSGPHAVRGHPEDGSFSADEDEDEVDNPRLLRSTRVQPGVAALRVSHLEDASAHTSFSAGKVRGSTETVASLHAKESPRSPRFGVTDDELDAGGEDEEQLKTTPQSFPARRQTSRLQREAAKMGSSGFSSRRGLVAGEGDETPGELCVHSSQGDSETASTLTGTPREILTLSPPSSFPPSITSSFPPPASASLGCNKRPEQAGFTGLGACRRAETAASPDEQESGTAETRAHRGRQEEEDGEHAVDFVPVEDQEQKLRVLQELSLAKYVEMKRAPVSMRRSSEAEETETVEQDADGAEEAAVRPEGELEVLSKEQPPGCADDGGEDEKTHAEASQSRGEASEEEEGIVWERDGEQPAEQTTEDTGGGGAVGSLADLEDSPTAVQELEELQELEIAGQAPPVDDEIREPLGPDVPSKGSDGETAETVMPFSEAAQPERTSEAEAEPDGRAHGTERFADAPETGTHPSVTETIPGCSKQRELDTGDDFKSKVAAAVHDVLLSVFNTPAPGVSTGVDLSTPRVFGPQLPAGAQARTLLLPAVTPEAVAQQHSILQTIGSKLAGSTLFSGETRPGGAWPQTGDSALKLKDVSETEKTRKVLGSLLSFSEENSNILLGEVPDVYLRPNSASPTRTGELPVADSNLWAAAAAVTIARDRDRNDTEWAGGNDSAGLTPGSEGAGGTVPVGSFAEGRDVSPRLVGSWVASAKSGTLARSRKAVTSREAPENKSLNQQAGKSSTPLMSMAGPPFFINLAHPSGGFLSAIPADAPGGSGRLGHDDSVGEGFNVPSQSTALPPAPSLARRNSGLGTPLSAEDALGASLGTEKDSSVELHREGRPKADLKSICPSLAGGSAGDADALETENDNELLPSLSRRVELHVFERLLRERESRGDPSARLLLRRIQGKSSLIPAELTGQVVNRSKLERDQCASNPFCPRSNAGPMCSLTPRTRRASTDLGRTASAASSLSEQSRLPPDLSLGCSANLTAASGVPGLGRRCVSRPSTPREEGRNGLAGPRARAARCLSSLGSRSVVEQKSPGSAGGGGHHEGGIVRGKGEVSDLSACFASADVLNKIHPAFNKAEVLDLPRPRGYGSPPDTSVTSGQGVDSAWPPLRHSFIEDNYKENFVGTKNQRQMETWRLADSLPIQSSVTACTTTAGGASPRGFYPGGSESRAATSSSVSLSECETVAPATVKVPPRKEHEETGCAVSTKKPNRELKRSRRTGEKKKAGGSGCREGASAEMVAPFCDREAAQQKSLRHPDRGTSAHSRRGRNRSSHRRRQKSKGTSPSLTRGDCTRDRGTSRRLDRGLSRKTAATSQSTSELSEVEGRFTDDDRPDESDTKHSSKKGSEERPKSKEEDKTREKEAKVRRRFQSQEVSAVVETKDVGVLANAVGERDGERDETASQSEKRSHDSQAEKLQEAVECRQEQEKLLLATEKHVEALHEEMDRLLKENTGLREERVKQEHKIQQIIKSASRTKARLLALKADKSREECLKEGDGRRAELEDLEKQLATLKETFLGKQEQQQQVIAELSEALSESRRTEGMWTKRAQDLRTEVVKGLQAREVAAMQMEDLRLRYREQTELMRKTTFRLSSTTQQKIHFEKKLSELISLMRRMKEALQNAHHEAALHKKAREDLERDFARKRANCVASGVQTDDKEFKNQLTQADFEPPPKPSSTIGVQAGHPREANLLEAEISAREQKLASALGKQKQLTLHVRTEYKKRAAAWATERAELQALVLSLQGRNAELEKVQRMVLGSSNESLHGLASGSVQSSCTMVGAPAAACSLAFPVAGSFSGYPCAPNAGGTEDRITGSRREPGSTVERTLRGNGVFNRREQITARETGDTRNAHGKPGQEPSDCERLSRACSKHENHADGEESIAAKLRSLCADANQKLEEQRQELEKQLSEQLAALEDTGGNGFGEEKKGHAEEKSERRGTPLSRQKTEEDELEENRSGKTRATLRPFLFNTLRLQPDEEYCCKQSAPRVTFPPGVFSVPLRKAFQFACSPLPLGQLPRVFAAHRRRNAVVALG
ncbi:hypothetical protein CSUI_003918 [Cystoisospora suis]|uniref:Uncharacterized protein n=1 Tax=Cystoisospora suis TaxID=483139 RepID=A0A2C6L3L7_9APIC|nr:hypothetical protein CSUI_003918 [Cystoisospora suis]